MLEWRKLQLRRRLQESRYRLKCMYQEDAKILYDMTFVATKDVWRISTNGKCIYFEPTWFQKLADKEMDYILLHQLMHIVLGHIDRPAYYRGDRYHLAADIVANGTLYELGWKYERIPHIGKIRYETFLPTVNGATLTSIEAIRYIPFAPSVMEPTKRRQFMIDSEEWWGRKSDEGEAGEIVLSPMNEDPDDLVYDGPTYGGKFSFKKEFFPNVINDGEEENNDDSSIHDTIRRLRLEVKEKNTEEDGNIFERYWNKSKVKQLNWKEMLDSFVQEDVYDYSFTPPDRRMQESDFFLPDYNAYHETIRDVLFMVDTSGSVSDEMLSLAFEEIKQALEQFQNTLSGTVAFFDMKVYKAMPFEGIEDISKMRPLGGGGTDYRCIFEFINEGNLRSTPTSIVVITDGEGVYPDEMIARGIPVLWLICGDNVAPWGKNSFIL